MNLYVDDDSVDALLVRLLRQAGHDVMILADVGLAGEDDVVHLIRAIEEDRLLLSHNYRDFENLHNENLHNLIFLVGGSYPGILMVRRDGNRRRDMSNRTIVLAIGKLIAANAPINDQFIILNQWR